jgi:hypothetical protein
MTAEERAAGRLQPEAGADEEVTPQTPAHQPPPAPVYGFYGFSVRILRIYTDMDSTRAYTPLHPPTPVTT